MLYRSILVLFTVSLISCSGGSSDSPQPFTFEIDTALVPSQPTLSGLDNGQPREVGVMSTPNGSTVEYVLDELIFRPADQADLDTFLTLYGGTVLRDGTVPVGDGTLLADAQESSGWYLIQIDPATSTVDDLPSSLRERNVGGEHAFSSERAAATASVMAREFNRDLRPNFLFQPTAINEHADNSSGFLDAETWAWMTEDDDSNTPGDQGLSVGVIHAWEYLDYLGVPPANGTFEPPVIAIIDGGFALDASGDPTNGNTDYFPSRPAQFDLVDYDGSAGGPNLMTCGGSPCPWHGTGAFGVALARHSNQYGGAGTSGNVAWPMLIRVDSSFYTISNAIRAAAINGADVISLSLGGAGCSVDAWVCSIPPDDIYETMQNAIDLATTFGAVVLAAAGNDGIDVATDEVLPCELARVICVGSVDGSKQNVFNYGAGVDIWAPTGVFSTVSPDSADTDSNDTGTDELYRFGGTSASTPFVAGIVGLMKALDPDIRWERVQNILQQTANVSSDTRVAAGYVDAYRAVQAVRDNPVPSIAIVSPSDGSDISYRPSFFTADASDPENDNPDSGVVTWTSDVDGELCTVQGFFFASLSTQCSPVLSLGTHVIMADAVDAHGASMQDAVTVQAINHPPTIQVTQFAPGTSFFSNQTITLGALANDVDEGPPFDQDRLIWSSNLDGELGSGSGLEVSLSIGVHNLTAVATDEFGSTAEDTTSVTIAVGDGVPSVQILQPTVGAVGPDTTVTFRATAIDPEDGALTGASLQWISSIDGTIGTGTEFDAVLSAPVIACNPETVLHTITLRVTDSDGHVVIETTQVRVGIIC